VARRLPREAKALGEVGLMFFPALPAYLWLWPAVAGTAFWFPVQVLIYLYVLAGTMLIGLRRWSATQLGLNRLGLGLSLAFGAALLAGRTLVILGTDLPKPAGLPPADQIVRDLLFYFLAVGLVEELLFRGLIYRALEDWRGVRWAVWGSAVLFGFYHLGGSGPVGAAGAFMIGAYLGGIRHRAGGIAGLVLIHGASDLGALWLAPPLGIMALERIHILHPGLVALGYGLIGAGALALWRPHLRRRPSTRSAAAP
jgi:membrane protease YdiL (CAAX protease family)